MAFEPWRYPGIFNLNQSAQLPNSFAPPNVASMFQTGISALADPLVARMKEEQARSEMAKKAADTLAAFGTQYAPTAATPGTTASTGTTAAPMRTSSIAGSPADDDTGGVQGGGAQGTSTALLDASRRAIGTVESGGNYSAVGPATKSGDRAYGMFQVMGNNVGPWTEKHFGQRLSPQDFLRNPEAQEAVFRGEFGGYLDRYGNIRDAASKWFSGRPYAEASRSNASDGYNTVDQYVAKVARNLDRRIPTPPPAPTASFAPQVAPAPSPAAAASVTAPATPQQAPQPQPKFTAPNVGQADYQRAIYDALNRGDKQKASELAAERDMVAAQQAQQEPAPQQQAGPQQGPGPQSQAPSPQQQQQAQQAQVIGNVAQTAAENDQRLDAERQAGQRTRVASISPELPGLGLGGVMPGAAQPGGPAPPPRPQPPSPAMGEPSFFSPEPMVPPQFAARPVTPAPSPAASAPAAPAGPSGPPPQQPAGVPPPYQVAQAQGLPPVVSVPQQQQVRPISREQARVLLNNATTPEELNRVAALLYKNQQEVQQQAAPTPNRFDIKGGYVLDSLTGAARPLTQEEKAAQHAGNFQWNPRTQRYDIPIGPAAGSNAPPTKEQFEQEYKLRDKFESDPETRRYAVATNAYGQMRSSANSGNGVGDISLIYQYMKMLDPDTGVREGEYANAAASGGVPDRIVNWYNKAVSGERLSDKQRADFVNEAGRLLQVRHGNVSKAADRVRRNAKAYQLDPDRVAQIDEYKYEPWQVPLGPDGRPRNDPGGVEADRAANAPGSEANPIPLPDDKAAAAKTLRAMPSKKWYSITRPDGSVVVDQKP